MDVRAERTFEYRGYQIKPDKKIPNQLIIVTAGRGGKIPNILDGGYTSGAIAKRYIDAYLESKEK